ncbi:hypothetical protein [Chondromyces crocatus]|uniref:N-acetyltransferase domain-containing protein n=1 Tax=Chondromyces crocatus TaxID=52 RepID=A0A0K1EQZ6_CHOCO|nr:hypothetical protein [Chondromyces crocatus]AKT43239.1 uncharacterized protein CMC5_074700 [Chondromyces crocatus]
MVAPHSSHSLSRPLLRAARILRRAAVELTTASPLAARDSLRAAFAVASAVFGLRERAPRLSLDPEPAPPLTRTAVFHDPDAPAPRASAPRDLPLTSADAGTLALRLAPISLLSRPDNDIAPPTPRSETTPVQFGLSRAPLSAPAHSQPLTHGQSAFQSAPPGQPLAHDDLLANGPSTATSQSLANGPSTATSQSLAHDEPFTHGQRPPRSHITAPPPLLLTTTELQHFPAEAGQLLREASPPPSIHYSDEYVAWHLGFPGPGAMTAIARSGAQPAAVFAITPRRFQLCGLASDGYLLSLLAIQPEHRRGDLAAQIYLEVLSSLRDRAAPTLVFADAHSAEEQLLLFRTVERLGFRMKRLHPLVNHGWSSRRAPRSANRTPLHAREARDVGEIREVIATCNDDRILWGAPDDAQLEHYLRDPRSRRLLVIEEEGRLTGAATILLGEIVNKPGSIVQVPTLDALWMPYPTTDRVTALFHATERLFAGAESASLVSAPNVSTLPTALLHTAGLRPTGAVYDGFLLHATRHPFLEADATNVEVT